MTGTDVITNRVREILEDATGTQRWTDAILLAFTNDGQRVLLFFHPELLLTDPNTLGSFYDASAVSSALYVPDDYRMALTDYVLMRAFAMDAQDKRDLARSKEHGDKFLMQTGLPGYSIGRA